MNAEESLSQIIARSREARQQHASRVSGLINSIASGKPYEFDPTNDGDIAASEGGELSEPEGQAGTVVGSAGEPNDPRSQERTEEEPSG